MKTEKREETLAMRLPAIGTGRRVLYSYRWRHKQ